MDEQASQLDALVNGVIDLVDGTDPLEHGVVTPRMEAAPPVEAEPEAEPEATEPPPEVKAEPAPVAKTKITWNGQEVELTPDELIAKAQMGFDYTQKTQELSKKAMELAPVEGLMKQLQGDPGLAAHIATYLRDKAAPQAPLARVQEKPPEDPVDKLKWEMRNEILAQVRQEMQQAAAPILHQQTVQSTLLKLQQDPDFRETHGAIVKHVESLPKSIKDMVIWKLDNDPRAYMEMFAEKKQEVIARRGNTTKPNAPIPTKVEAKAPVLEAPGAQPTASSVADQKKKSAALKKKAFQNGNPADLAAWLMESGAIDNIL